MTLPGGLHTSDSGWRFHANTCETTGTTLLYGIMAHGVETFED